MVELSIIIPAYNAEKTLGRCLDSILSQDVDLEVIVVDDFSSDGTADLCERYVEADSRVRLLRNAENIGQGLSRNRGIDVARGAFLAFSDSDDYVAPHMYEDLLALTRQGGLEIDVAGCDLFFPAPQEPKGEVARLTGVRFYTADQIRADVLPELLGSLPEVVNEPYTFPLSPCTYLYRSSLVRSHGLEFRSERLIYSEDLFFNYEVLECARGLAFTTAKYYHYTDNPGSTTHRYHDPITKIERLYMLAGDDADLRLRVDLTVVKSLICAALQLCTDDALTWREKREIFAALCDEPLIRSVLPTYPLEVLGARAQLFFACCTRPLSPIALAMAWCHDRFIRGRTLRPDHSPRKGERPEDRL